MNRQYQLKSLLFGLLFLFSIISGSAWGESSFLVGFWEKASLSRQESYRHALSQAVGKELQEMGFTEYSFETTADYQQRFDQLGEGRFALLECDPATYFVARRHFTAIEPQKWQYSLVFQTLYSATDTSRLQAAIITLNQKGYSAPEDLRGKILGILSPYGLAEGRVQLSVLRSTGLNPGTDFSYVKAPSERSLCKALCSGLVDAVALPRERIESFLKEETEPLILHDVQLKTLYESNTLPGPVWCVHQRLARSHPDFMASLRQKLPAWLSNETIIPTQDEYYITTAAWAIEKE